MWACRPTRSVNGSCRAPRCAVAYQQVQNWLTGAVMTACASDTNGVWTCQIIRQSGYTGWIVWAPGLTVNYPPPIRRGAQPRPSPARFPASQAPPYFPSATPPCCWNLRLSRNDSIGARSSSSARS